MAPALMGGAGTMSSAATMPLTLIGVEKNAKHPTLARSVIPMSVNNHLIGDCFAIPIFAFALLKNYGLAQPTFEVYFIFALFFVLAKFSVAAVPGGGILVMLPILQQYLGFTPPMLSLITALYVLFDPVITSANVMGNGAFALITSGLYETLFKRKKRH
jgi:Na+/H+-dicarboxylate symporter